jgi:hypothetical protein
VTDRSLQLFSVLRAPVCTYMAVRDMLYSNLPEPPANSSSSSSSARQHATPLPNTATPHQAAAQQHSSHTAAADVLVPAAIQTTTAGTGSSSAYKHGSTSLKKPLSPPAAGLHAHRSGGAAVGFHDSSAAQDTPVAQQRYVQHVALGCYCYVMYTYAQHVIRQ